MRAHEVSGMHSLAVIRFEAASRLPLLPPQSPLLWRRGRCSSKVAAVEQKEAGERERTHAGEKQESEREDRLEEMIREAEASKSRSVTLSTAAAEHALLPPDARTGGWRS